MDIKTQVKEGVDEANVSLLERIKALFTGQPVAKEITDKITGLESALAAAKAEVESSKTTHSAAITAKDLELSNLKATHATELKEAKAAASAALGKANIVPIPEPGAGHAAGGAQKTKREEYQALQAKDSEAAAKFFEAHSEDILAGK